MSRGPSLSRGFAPLLIAVSFVALCVWTWGTWPDVAVDFGREVYVPWRLREGDRLYRDVSYFTGPLSPHLNALMFALFGVSLRTLFCVNLALLAGFCVLLYRVMRELGDPLAALAAVLAFLAMFAFGQQTGIGNYNFIAPYSHEATHGLMLGVLALAAIARACARKRLSLIVIGGVCVGLSLLTKLEMAVAALGSNLVCLVCVQRQRLAPGSPTRVWSGFLAGVAVPPAIGSLFMPWSDVLAALFVSLNGRAWMIEFYRRGMGSDAPLSNALLAIAAAGAWCLLLAPAWVLARRPAKGHLSGVWLVAAYGLFFVGTYRWIPWPAAARALPIGCGIALAHCVVQVRRGSGELRYALGAGFAALGALLLGKMLLNSRFGHYGFVLAVPATLLSIVALVSWSASAFDRRGGTGNMLRWAGCGLCAMLALLHLERTERFIGQKHVAIGTGGDAFRADLRAVYLRPALARLTQTRAEETFAVLPEGVMLNYLARRSSSTPYLNFMPLELDLFGSERILQNFVAHPPTRIVLVHKDTTEYGYPLFGRDYAQPLRHWIDANYTSEARYGDQPLTAATRYGVELLIAKDQLPVGRKAAAVAGGESADGGGRVERVGRVRVRSVGAL